MHVDKVVSCTRAALEKAGIQKPDLVCATGGPGLVGAVLVGFHLRQIVGTWVWSTVHDGESSGRSFAIRTVE